MKKRVTSILLSLVLCLSLLPAVASANGSISINEFYSMRLYRGVGSRETSSSASFTIPTKGRVWLEFEINYSGFGKTTFDVTLSQGQKNINYYSVFSESSKVSNLIENVDYSLEPLRLPAGTYDLNFSASFGGNSNSANISYRINYISEDTSYETEWNDIPEQANVLTISEPTRGNLNAYSSGGDVDYYSFNLKEPGDVQIGFQHGSRPDEDPYKNITRWKVSVYNTLMALQSEMLVSEQETTKNSSSFQLPSGQYYIKISLADEAKFATPDYMLTVFFEKGSTLPPVYGTPSSWAIEQVNSAINAGLVPQDLRVAYTQATTRAEFCALAVALYETVKGSEITERKTFSDTTDVNVQKMAGLSVVNGMGDNKFSPNASLTREQAATMLSRLASAIGKPLTAQSPTFVDKASISSWAYDAVGQMQLSGVMGGVGDNTFSPLTDYTREQSIVTILRVYNIVK